MFSIISGTREEEFYCEDKGNIACSYCNVNCSYCKENDGMCAFEETGEKCYSWEFACEVPQHHWHWYYTFLICIAFVAVAGAIAGAARYHQIRTGRTSYMPIQ